MAAKTTPLTATQIKTAKATDKDITLTDGGGLILLVKQNGVKTWQLRYYKLGTDKRTTWTIGNYPEVSLADARERRYEAKALLSAGIDPQHHKRQQQAAEETRQGNTFSTIAAKWLELKRGHGLKADTLKDNWRSLELHIFPIVGDIPVTELKPQAVIKALHAVQARGNLEMVRRLCQRIVEIMDYAVNSGVIEENRLVNIRKAFPTPKKEHMPTIRPERLPELMRALNIASIELQTRRLIEWQLLTVSRPGEAAGTRWDEIDLDAKTWTIPAERMKKERAHTVPLCVQAIAILEAMKPISGHREYVFPSFKDPKKPMNSQSANAALKRMGFKGELVAHGNRSIFSTAANEKGFDSDIIEAALSHVDKNSVRASYNRADYVERCISLMSWWGDFVEAAATGSTLSGGTIRGIRAIR